MISTDTINNNTLRKILKLAIKVGKFQLKHFRLSNLSIQKEKLENEFVTQIDIESETKIKSGLQKIFPEAGFYGEETGRSSLQSVFEWIVDPIDGTTNFISGLDQFSISIALTHNNNPLLGLIYKPTTGEYYSAIKDKGAFYCGIPLLRAPGVSLKQSLIGTGFPYRSPDTSGAFFDTSSDLIKKTRGIRRFGSAALDLSYVALGHLQGFWEFDLKPYDVAAALVLLQETEISVLNENGTNYDMFKDSLLIAGNPENILDLRNIVLKHYNK